MQSHDKTQSSLRCNKVFGNSLKLVKEGNDSLSTHYFVFRKVSDIVWRQIDASQGLCAG